MVVINGLQEVVEVGCGVVVGPVVKPVVLAPWPPRISKSMQYKPRILDMTKYSVCFGMLLML